MSCCIWQKPLSPPPFSSSVHNFNIFMNLQHLEPLSAHKRLLFSSKAGNETNIVCRKSLEAWSSPLFSSLTLTPRGSTYKKTCVAVHISDSCTRWAKTHWLHLSRRRHIKRSLTATRRYPGKNRGTQPPKINPHTFQLSPGIASTRGYQRESKRYPKINSRTCQQCCLCACAVS